MNGKWDLLLGWCYKLILNKQKHEENLCCFIFNISKTALKHEES
jgi:hypothetical protein